MDSETLSRKERRRLSPYVSSEQVPLPKSELYWEHFQQDQQKEAAYLKAPRLPLVLVAHNVRSLYNLGSFFRTAEGVLLEKVYLTGYTAAPPRKEITKTALGAEEMVPWQKEEDIKKVLADLKAEGRTIYALERQEGSRSLMQAKFQFPAALLLGNEVDGLPAEVTAACDAVLHLPMRGVKSSLNVSVAFGAAAYECLRQWGQGG